MIFFDNLLLLFIRIVFLFMGNIILLFCFLFFCLPLSSDKNQTVYCTDIFVQFLYLYKNHTVFPGSSPYFLLLLAICLLPWSCRQRRHRLWLSSTSFFYFLLFFLLNHYCRSFCVLFTVPCIEHRNCSIHSH